MKKYKYIIFGLLTGILLSTNAQDLYLEGYIQEGLESNLALRQIQADYTKSLQSLRSAKGLFYPDINFQARYTVARGGRTIPVMEMLNPIYQTLNDFLLDPADAIPLLEDDFPFYRPVEQVTKLSLIQPVYSPKVIYNYQIKKEQINIETANIFIYKRELIKQIKTAYYGYLMTVYLLRLVDDTDVLLKENLRVSTSLYNNDMVTQDIVYRSEAELQKVYIGRAIAEKENQTARAYLNFLRNQPLNSEVNILEVDEIPEIGILSEIDEEITAGLNSREEINKLQSYSIMNETFTKLTRSSNYPNLFLAVDYGFQGAKYSFTSEDDFMLASVVLRWNLFQGLKNRADVQHARITSEQLSLKKEELNRQIELQIINAYYDLNAAIKAIEAARIQVRASEKAFRVMEEKYRIGKVRLIEYTDSRTTMTKSKQNIIMAVFEYKIKEAELERMTAERIFD